MARLSSLQGVSFLDPGLPPSVSSTPLPLFVCCLEFYFFEMNFSVELQKKEKFASQKKNPWLYLKKTGEKKKKNKTSTSFDAHLTSSALGARIASSRWSSEPCFHLLHPHQHFHSRHYDLCLADLAVPYVVSSQKSHRFQ